MAAAPDPVDYTTTIDSLLERYLVLLDEYTTLRSTLNSLQTGMYQNIARANFSAERGIRYGQDHYDDRMQAARRIEISRGGGGGDDTTDLTSNANNLSPAGRYAFEVAVVPASAEVKVKTGEEEKDDEDEQTPHLGGDEHKHEHDEQGRGDQATNTPTNNPPPSDEQQSSEENTTRPVQPKNDPLRWFGLLTPSALRQAQGQAIQAVEGVIPRLAAVNMAMAEVELEVRRARKKRAKAEAAAEKERERVEKEEEEVEGGVYRGLERLDLSGSGRGATVV